MLTESRKVDSEKDTNVLSVSPESMVLSQLLRITVARGQCRYVVQADPFFGGNGDCFVSRYAHYTHPIHYATQHSLHANPISVLE